MTEEESESNAITIKKYANRRLYNTATSGYVTLDYLADLVRKGTDFSVRDAKTGEDLTRSVLAQIIFEEEARGSAMLPENFMRRLIRLYGDTLQASVPSYLDASMEAFAHNQERIRTQVEAAMSHFSGMSDFEAMARRNLEWWEQATRMMIPGAAFGNGGGSRGTPPPGDAPSNPKEALRELQAEIGEMQRRIDALAKLANDG